MSDTLKDLYDKREALQGLLVHPGWKLLCDLTLLDREQVRSLIEDSPLPSMDKALEQEYIKGRCYQMKVQGNVPQYHIDNFTAEIEAILQENTNDIASERIPGDPESGSDDGDASGGLDRAP